MPLLKKQRRYSPSRGIGLSENVVIYGGAHNLLRSGLEGGRRDDGGSTQEDEGCCEDESGSEDEPPEDMNSIRENSPPPQHQLADEPDKEAVPLTVSSMGSMP